MRVVVAPDKFKGSLTAAQVADRVAAGLIRVAPGVEVVKVPVADGGDGTLEAAVSAGYRRVPVRAEGPTGDPVDTAYAERGGVAVVELADVSGLRRLPGGRLTARAASSYGTGQVIRAALDAGCRRIVLGRVAVTSVGVLTTSVALWWRRREYARVAGTDTNDRVTKPG